MSILTSVTNPFSHRERKNMFSYHLERIHMTSRQPCQLVFQNNEMYGSHGGIPILTTQWELNSFLM